MPPFDEQTSGQEKKDSKNKARVKDLEYYLGKEWIDFHPIISDNQSRYYRNVATSSYQPKKCPVCKKYWVNTITGERGELSPRSLGKHYFNIPADEETCWEC